MDLNLMKELIKRRKAKSFTGLEEENSEQKAEMPEDKEDGLAPEMVMKEDASGDSDDDMDLEKMAELVLGRKPMSLSKDGDDEDDDALSAEEMDEDVLSAMKDDRVLEMLERGKEPSKLWEKVQARIAKMKK